MQSSPDHYSDGRHFEEHRSTDQPRDGGLLTVIHLVEASGGHEYMFGKEKVIHWLMREQRDSRTVIPQLAQFSPGKLASVVENDGFAVSILEDHQRRLPTRSLPALMRVIARANRPVLHTHGYKANIVGRIALRLGAPLGGLVSTCHGFIDETVALRVYNTVDRLSGIASSVVTAPDRRMLKKFPSYVRTMFVPNAIPDRKLPTDAERCAARAALGWPQDAFVAGMLGRFSVEKGITNFIEAARKSPNEKVIWAAAGAGTMETDLRGSNIAALHVVGYVSPSDDYLSALDVYVQPSFTEGLSLSLLEAMRSGTAIVATNVGSTDAAIRHDREGLLVRPDPEELSHAVTRLYQDRELARRLGAAARRRFEELFRIETLSRTFYDLYMRAAA